jgi:hypothetical protein
LYANIKDSKSDIDPQSIPEGVNNRFIKNISFNFFMTDYKIGYMKMTDAENTRFRIPDDAFTTPGMNPTMRMEMLGF